MSRMLVAMLAALAISCVWAAVPEWQQAPAVYEIDGDTMTASDGGGSTGDHYLLSTREYTDFILSFDITALKPGGERVRAIVVWAIDESRANRDSIFLPTDRFAIEKTRHVDVVKIGERVALKIDGEVVARSHNPYGRPLERGPVGFLHYYNYHFRYSSVQIRALEAEALPKPRDFSATVLPSGVVDLSWTLDAAYEGLVEYQVARTEPDADKPVALPSTRATSAQDTTAVTGGRYTYTVSALMGDEAGPGSDPASVTIAQSRPPGPPEDVQALLRIDGSARLSWKPAPDSRVAGYRVLRGDEVLADELPLTARRFSAKPSEALDYTVAALDPDGKQDAPKSVRAEPTAPVVDQGREWPSRHPYLKWSAADIDRLRRSAQVDETARKTVENLRRAADGIVRKPPNVPRERSDDHRRMPGPIRTVSEAYAASGDDKYAAWVREAMLAYADLYPTLEPFSGGRARIVGTGSGLYEATWYVPVICAYDLTYDSPVYTPEDHEKIARDLLRPAAELFWVRDYAAPGDYRAHDLHYKCYNFQAWFISAVGLTGLLLRDPEMVEHAIDGPYGLKHLLKHDVHDDGIFWERSLGYHSFVLSALLPFLEAAYHCNLDLWRLEVADDYNEDREPLANYTVGDGDNGPKSIKTMLDGPFYAMYGNRTYANISDSNAGPLRAGEYYQIAYKRLGDPKYAWLYRQDHKAPQTGELHSGDADLAGNVRCAYDDQHLFIGAQITDDVVRNTWSKPEEAWRGDLLWVGLKWSDGEGGPYDFIYGLTPGDFDKVPAVPVIFNRFSAASHTVSTGEYKVAKTARGYNIEIAIPWSEYTPQAGEDGTPLKPQTGDEIVVDFVLYDGDPATGSSSKEKMLCWSCTSDRYASAQGGSLVFAQDAPDDARAINAPRADGLVIDGSLDDWDTLPAKAAGIGEGSSIMTDSGSAGPSLLSQVYGTPPQTAAWSGYLGRTFCNNGVLQEGCSLYPSTGFAVLRERLDDNGFVPPDATCVTLNCGPHGGGHGHSDLLSIVLYADGKQWIPDFGSCTYGSTEKQTWTAQTISHNTVVVDETSQYPTGAATPSWPCDSAGKQARGFFDFFRCGPTLKAAQGHTTAAYEGVTLRRTTALVGDTLVDFLEAKSEDEHTYDYALHIAGELGDCSAALEAQDDLLPDKPGYQHIENVRLGSSDEAIGTVWTDGTRQLRVTAAPAGGSQVIIGDGITTALDRKMPTLILRRRAKSTVFATVMQPYTTDEPEQPVWIDAPGDAMAVRVPTADGPMLVVFNPDGETVRVEGQDFPGSLGARRVGAD